MSDEQKHDDGCHEKPHFKINFKVDSEPVEVLSKHHDHTELSVREVLDISANTPADQFWLVEFRGEGHSDRHEFKNLDEKIVVHQHARFSAICEKPTPVS